MSKLDKLFDLVNKVDRTVSTADRLDYTVGRVENRAERMKSSKSGKIKWLIYIAVVVIAILYIFG